MHAGCVAEVPGGDAESLLTPPAVRPVKFSRSRAPRRVSVTRFLGGPRVAPTAGSLTRGLPVVPGEFGQIDVT